MNAGTTPKLTASASESISSPIRDVALSTRATRPSSASSTAASTRSAIAHVARLSIDRLLSWAYFTAVNPREMAATVIALGKKRSVMCA